MLNLVNELFGREQTPAVHADSGLKVSAHVPDLGVTDDVVRRRATIFFIWIAAFIALVALIGFVPAIAVFVFAYMRFGFGEPGITVARLCRGHHLGLLCGVSLGAWRGLAAVVPRRIISGLARGDALVLAANYCTIAAAFFATSGGVW